MKRILLVGASSTISQKFIERHSTDFDLIKMSRTNDYSDVSDFNIFDESTYFDDNLKFDGIIYFPGTINLKPFKRLNNKDFMDDFNINVIGLLTVLKFYEKKINKNSSVVLFSSIAANIGMPFHSSISISKGAILSLTRSLAAEWSPKIRVNCISPSLINTKMGSKFLSDENMISRMNQKHPMQRVGRPEDLSSLIHFLISNESSWITGQNFNVDGGMSTIKI